MYIERKNKKISKKKEEKEKSSEKFTGKHRVQLNSNESEFGRVR